MAHAFNRGPQEAEAGWISELKARLVYELSSKTAKAKTKQNKNNCIIMKSVCWTYRGRVGCLAQDLVLGIKR